MSSLKYQSEQYYSSNFTLYDSPKEMVEGYWVGNTKYYTPISEIDWWNNPKNVKLKKTLGW